MLSIAIGSSTSFAPTVAPAQSRTAVRMESPLMVSEDASSRRELFARAGAAVFGLSAVQSASAKAGQFSKLDIFSVIGEPAISSPYQPGGPKGNLGPGGIEKGTTTYGYAKSDGPILANGFRDDVTREKQAFLVSSKIVESQAANIESKTWWLVRDNFRGQAYNMKANMQALNEVQPADKKAAVKKAYSKFWSEVNSLDLACTKKELDLAKKEYADVLEALKAYTALIS